MAGTTIERERKFLVTRRPAGLARRQHHVIDQGYLTRGKDGAEVRVRRYGRRFFLTAKIGAGAERREEEIALSRSDFRRLWRLTKDRRIHKTRYRVPIAGPKDSAITIDVYRGTLRGLMLAEAEFWSAKAMAAFDPPPWVGREVTGVRRFSNSRLAAVRRDRRK